MHPFKPMLAKRVNIRSIPKTIKSDSFWIEEKVDGERIQLHKDDNEYRYWSRNIINFSEAYGTTPNAGSLTPFIHSQFDEKIVR